MLAEAGIPAHVAIKISGHAGIEVYIKNYVKVEKDTIEEARKKTFN
jgi:hypothetical protein